MFITPSFKKSLIVEQFQGNYLKCVYLGTFILGDPGPDSRDEAMLSCEASPKSIASSRLSAPESPRKGYDVIRTQLKSWLFDDHVLAIYIQFVSSVIFALKKAEISAETCL